MKKVVKELIAARDLLLDVGWTQGQYKKYDTTDTNQIHLPVAYCVIGAVNTTVRNDVDGNWWDMNAKLVKYLHKALPPSAQRKTDSATALIDYNDRKGRTKKRMIQLFDDAIKLAQEDGSKYLGKGEV